jgi:hypothetical protein
MRLGLFCFDAAPDLGRTSNYFITSRRRSCDLTLIDHLINFYSWPLEPSFPVLFLTRDPIDSARVLLHLFADYFKIET